MSKISVLSIVLVLVVFLLAVAFPVVAQEEPGDGDCWEVILNFEDGSEIGGPCEGEPEAWFNGDESPLPDGVSFVVDELPDDTEFGEVVESESDEGHLPDGITLIGDELSDDTEYGETIESGPSYDLGLSISVTFFRFSFGW